MVLQRLAMRPVPERGARINSVDDYVDGLGERFVPANAKGLSAVFQWDIAGPGGRVFHAVVRQQAITVVDGKHPAPTLTLVVNDSDFVPLINGEIDRFRLFLTGRAKVKGSLRLAIKMKRLFPAA